MSTFDETLLTFKIEQLTISCDSIYRKYKLPHSSYLSVENKELVQLEIQDNIIQLTTHFNKFLNDYYASVLESPPLKQKVLFLFNIFFSITHNTPTTVELLKNLPKFPSNTSFKMLPFYWFSNNQKITSLNENSFLLLKILTEIISDDDEKEFDFLTNLTEQKDKNYTLLDIVINLEKKDFINQTIYQNFFFFIFNSSNFIKTSQAHTLIEKKIIPNQELMQALKNKSYDFKNLDFWRDMRWINCNPDFLEIIFQEFNYNQLKTLKESIPELGGGSELKTFKKVIDFYLALKQGQEIELSIEKTEKTNQSKIL